MTVSIQMTVIQLIITHMVFEMPLNPTHVYICVAVTRNDGNPR